MGAMNNLRNLVDELASKDGVVREQARKALVASKGNDVVQALIGKLADPRRQVRWEATKALSDIANPVAAAALVQAMHDENTEIAWLAAEGVAGLGEPGLLAVLGGLTSASHSAGYCTAAYHAFKMFCKMGKHCDELLPVMKALEGIEPKLTAPVAAYEALQKLRLGEATPVT